MCVHHIICHLFQQVVEGKVVAPTTRLPKRATAIQVTPLLRTSGDFSSVFGATKIGYFSVGSGTISICDRDRDVFLTPIKWCLCQNLSRVQRMALWQDRHRGFNLNKCKGALSICGFDETYYDIYPGDLVRKGSPLCENMIIYIYIYIYHFNRHRFYFYKW